MEVKLPLTSSNIVQQCDCWTMLHQHVASVWPALMRTILTEIKMVRRHETGTSGL